MRLRLTLSNCLLLTWLWIPVPCDTRSSKETWKNSHHNGHETQRGAKADLGQVIPALAIGDLSVRSSRFNEI